MRKATLCLTEQGLPIISYPDHVKTKVGADFYVGQQRHVVVSIDKTDPETWRVVLKPEPEEKR